jgi:crotonobetainyl-CoA:carnitine CoA-transferase CaiB-like acyl-CoA transferase
MYGTGQPDAEPMSMAPRLNLCFAGKTAAVATLAAVLHGRGDWIDVSIMETLVASIDRRADSLVSYIYCGEKMVRMPFVGLPGSPPTYTRTADGWIQLSASSSVWPALEALMDEDREPAGDRLERWRAWCEPRAKQDIVRRLQAASVPAAPVKSVADLASDEHLAARVLRGSAVAGMSALRALLRDADVARAAGAGAREHTGRRGRGPGRPVEPTPGALPSRASA